MFRFDRAMPVAVVFVLGLSLSACSSSGTGFDPTELLQNDWFNSKDKLTGERKPVFPDGVPGVPQGVPPEMIKGNQQAATAPESAPQASAPQPAPARPAAQPAKPKPKPQPKTASAPPAQPRAASPAPAQQPAAQPAAPWPDPAPARSGQSKSNDANWPEPAANNAWPPPDPNTFSR